GEHRGQHGPADDAGVGDVEDRPDVTVVAGQADPVDDMAAADAGGPEDPVGQVADRAAKDAPEGDTPADRPHPPGGAQDEGDDGQRDQRQHDRRAGAQGEGGAGVAGLDQVDTAAE